MRLNAVSVSVSEAEAHYHFKIFRKTLQVWSFRFSASQGTDAVRARANQPLSRSLSSDFPNVEQLAQLEGYIQGRFVFFPASSFLYIWSVTADFPGKNPYFYRFRLMIAPFGGRWLLGSAANQVRKLAFIVLLTREKNRVKYLCMVLFAQFFFESSLTGLGFYGRILRPFEDWCAA